MGDDLGVGVGRELATGLGQMCLKRRSILHDAVVHHGEASGRIAVGMRIAVARLAMRRPSRVRDSVGALERAMRRSRSAARAICSPAPTAVPTIGRS